MDSATCENKNVVDKDNKVYVRLSRELLDKVTEVSSSLCSNEENTIGELSDKAIAAQAVSVVVGSARKGLVPLCATVACVLKEKSRLECKLKFVQNQLNLITQQEYNPSNPNGETLFSASKESTGKKSRSFSRRCQMVLAKSYNYNSKNPARVGDQKKKNVSEVIVTEAVVHCAENVTGNVSIDSETVASPAKRRMSKQSTSSVSSTDEVIDELLRVQLSKRRSSDAGTISVVVRTNPTADAFTETVPQITSDAWTNTIRDCDSHDCPATLHWKEEIRKSKQHEQILEEKLMQVTSVLLESRKVFTDTTNCPCQSLVKRAVGSNTDFTLPPLEKGHLTHDVQDRVLSWMKLSKKQLRGPLFAPFPLSGCLCHKCAAALESEKLCSKENAAVYKICHKENPILEINDRVMIPGNRVGLVAYIGHLDKTEAPAAVFIGIKLDKPEGNCDGLHQDKHYFYAPPDHGLFLPINNVLFIVNQKTNTKVGQSQSSCSKRKPKTFKRLRSLSENAAFHS